MDVHELTPSVCVCVCVDLCSCSAPCPFPRWSTESPSVANSPLQEPTPRIRSIPPCHRSGSLVGVRPHRCFSSSVRRTLSAGDIPADILLMVF